MSDLNDRLKAAGVYDINVAQDEALSGPAQSCDYKKSCEPVEPEINVLIVGVTAIVKTVF